MTTTVAPPAELAPPRRLRVCSYVALPFDAVLDGVTASELLAAAATSFGEDGWVHPRADRPVVVSRGVASARVWWTPAGDPGARAWAGVSLLAVQGGRDAVTELLVEVPVPCTTGAAEAATARRFLRALDEALTLAVAA